MNCVNFGKSVLPIPSKFFGKAEWLIPKEDPIPLLNVQHAVIEALRSPIGSKPLREKVKIEDRIAIIVSDITRPVPTAQILPPLLDELRSCGIPVEKITIIFGLGIHRSMTTAEKAQVLGEEVFLNYRAIEPQEYVCLGETTRGTPIEVCREVAEADFVILTGNIEYHYFAGYSGGYKALMPGVSTKKAIQNNHKMMLHPKAAIGTTDENPVRNDIEEFGRVLPNTFLLNVLLGTQKEVTHVLAGDPILAHRVGCGILDQYFKVRVPKAADLIIVSSGGYPKDINLYQAQKALENAARVTKEGGTIVLVAELKEGFGEETFKQWLENCKSTEEILARIQKEFVLGGHKAAAIAMLLKNYNIYLLSTLPAESVRNVFLKPLDNLSDLPVKEADIIYILPYGNQTLPELQ
ncbi:nickel-dependent lactate racemase [Sporomusa sp.]|uniref:nickel-dependent lactate racemase n=1 Tax=Sporomusa sp. TaxID=2078658 RepID=UPI002BB70209|nr:nickel-dependent lactate racemase [Sporomusa sp.]HWR45854.1 nickel-dependent lactate racemase [Sporomusa sp.]